MYRRYSASGSLGNIVGTSPGSGVMTSTSKTLINMTSTAAIRPYIYDFTFGTVGTPSDSVVTLVVTRFGTASISLGQSVAPSPLDTSDAAAVSAVFQANSVEGTYGVLLFEVGLNVRATYRWVAAPGGELIAAAGGAVNSTLRIGAQSPAYVLDAAATIYYAE